MLGEILTNAQLLMEKIKKEKQETPNLLDIYYIIDYPEEIDTEMMQKYFKIYLNVHFNINMFQKIEAYPYPHAEENNDIDVIKNGLYSFNKMFNELKLKSKNTTWFFYLTNGDIDNQIKYKNIDVILLNKNISEKECFYNINKININILKTFSIEDKFNKLKIFKNNLNILFSSKDLLKYDKINLNLN